jgi:NTE family protein
MRAFVLSGGGNRGPLEIGAIRVLLENGIVPEMVVGTSAGAINGAFLALNPIPEQTLEMARLWKRAGERKLIDGSSKRALWQLARGADFVSENKGLRDYALSKIPPEMRKFGQLPIPLYVTIAHLRTHTLYIYGDDPEAEVIDAVITSAAVPGFFPPMVHEGELYVDGGVVSNLPIKLAIARGATEIWAIDLAFDIEAPRQLRGIFTLTDHSMRPIAYARAINELKFAQDHPNVTVHHIPIYDFQDIALGDFSKVDAMVEAGAQVAREYLSEIKPNGVRTPKKFAEDELPMGPTGSRPFLDL